MEELKHFQKLLEECIVRVKDISDIITEDLDDDAGKKKISDLYEVSKEMDYINNQAKLQFSSINKCKTTLSEVDEPWSCIVQKMFEENIEKESEKGSKKKDKYYKELEKHLKKKNDNDKTLEVVEEERAVIDPWTKQPIQEAIQSKTCKHLYDKRSIACIIRNRNQFKCPYVGCQNVVSQQDLVELEDDD